MVKPRRLVALFDILGFGTRLKTSALAATRHEIRELIRAIRSHAFSERPEPGISHGDNVEHARFVFDSVLLVSFEVSELVNIHNFVLACIGMLELGFERLMPFRGSITVSDVFVDEETGLLLGTEFPALRDGEAMQDWSGCFIHPPAVPMICDAMMGAHTMDQCKRAPSACNPLLWYQLPVKKECVERSSLGATSGAWCLNWVDFSDSRSLSTGLAFLAGDPAKQSHTSRFVEYVRGLPNETRKLEGDAVPPGTFVKVMKGRAGVRVKLVDADGNRASLPNAITLPICISRSRT